MTRMRIEDLSTDCTLSAREAGDVVGGGVAITFGGPAYPYGYGYPPGGPGCVDRYRYGSGFRPVPRNFSGYGAWNRPWGGGGPGCLGPGGHYGVYRGYPRVRGRW